MRRKTHNEKTDSPAPEAHVPAEESVVSASGNGAAAAVTEAPAELDPRDRELEALRARIAELEQALEQERDQHLRVLADFQNYRRRSEEQKAEIRRFANRELILGLLPVLDNFERALQAAEKNKSYEALAGGVALTHRQLLDYLKQQGVEPIEAVGEEFDPNLHEAVQRVEGDQPDNTVVQDVRKGYRMHDRVLRPSQVTVARSE